MNIFKQHILWTVAAMSLCGIVSSCSQDDFGMIPDSERSLKLTATVEGMVSRADNTAFWNDGDTIRVRIRKSKDDTDYYPWVGRYALNTDGSVKDAIDALAWPYENGFVSAWYPFLQEGAEVSITDQSKGYHSFDFLEAHTDEVKNYKDIVNLNFKHLMAKVRCEFIKGDGVTEEDLKTAKIKYYGIPTVKFSEAGIEGIGSTDYITPASDYSALMVPQNVKGLPFITVDLTLTINDAQIPKTLVYTPQEAMNLEAGIAYTFNIKVQKDRLEVQTISGEWKEDKASTEPTSDKYRIYLPEITDTLGVLEFSKNVKEVTADTRAGSGRLVEVIGNTFTISFKSTLKNCSLGLVFVDNSKKNQVKRIYFEKESEGYYEFTYTIASPIGEPVYLEIGEHIEVGDILFDDRSCGSISNKIYESEEFKELKKVPVGIVFRVGPGGDREGQILDVPDTYKNCEGWNGHKIRGYAVALKDATAGREKWYINNRPRIFPTTDSIHKYYSGLYIADRLKINITTLKLKISDFQAFQKAEDYKPVAPVGTSGWYLPSYHQLKDIRNLFEHPLRREWMTKAGGNFFTLRFPYCSATEQSTGNIYIEAFAYDGDYDKLLETISKSYGYAVRSVLTF